MNRQPLKHWNWIAGAMVAVLALTTSSAQNVGDMAPDFSRTALTGNTVQLADYRGKLVLLNFWASWCPPCLEEMPIFSRWQQDYGARGLQVIGVSMDDAMTPVKNLLAKHPVTYPILMGDAKLGESFGGILGLPTSYLIDPRGRLVVRYRGESNLAQMEAKIKELLPH
jgi:peroxiredoxin